MRNNWPMKPEPNYSRILKADAPRIFTEGRALIGVRETAGSGNNPVIMGWARALDLRSYNADSIPWCGLYMAYVAQRAGWDPVRDPLWARNWANFGAKSETPSLGDVLVFSRGPAFGHVGIYVGEDATHYHVLGGNQGDRVSIIRIAKARLIAARRPIWLHAEPETRRQVFFSSTASAISNNEA